MRDPRSVLNAGRAQSHPACFDNSKQYRDWVWLNRQSSQPHDPAYCLDCTPEYKNKMLAQNKCAHPETRFVIWSNKYRELEVIGVCNESRYWDRVERGITILNWADDGEDQQSSKG